jgi:hypothetical protein
MSASSHLWNDPVKVFPGNFFTGWSLARRRDIERMRVANLLYCAMQGLASPFLV